METVAVLMSTYNGESYLREQVESILSQKDVDVELVIRDDGSTDGTIDIINELSRDYSNIHFITGQNMGYANSFLTLLKYDIEADYYAFADQDDVWEESKLANAINKIRLRPYSVYASALQIVDENLKPISYKKYSNYRATVGSVLSRIRLAGCTMVFGDDLKKKIEYLLDDIIEFNKFNYGHDAWIMLLALLNSGDIVVDGNSYIKYRRHAQTITNINGGLKKRIKNELRIFWNKNNTRVKIANFLLKYGTLFDPAVLVVIEDISFYQKNIAIRTKLIFGDEIITNLKSVDFKNKLAVLLGRY